MPTPFPPRSPFKTNVLSIYGYICNRFTLYWQEGAFIHCHDPVTLCHEMSLPGKWQFPLPSAFGTKPPLYIINGWGPGNYPADAFLGSTCMQIRIAGHNDWNNGHQNPFWKDSRYRGRKACHACFSPVPHGARSRREGQEIIKKSGPARPILFTMAFNLNWAGSVDVAWMDRREWKIKKVGREGRLRQSTLNRLNYGKQ